jgi:hypothetical protein
MQERTCSDSFKINKHSGAEAYKEKLLATGLTTSALQSVYTGKEMAKVFACDRRYSRILALFFV